jgi:hypothetical protein
MSFSFIAFFRRSQKFIDLCLLYCKEEQEFIILPVNHFRFDRPKIGMVEAALLSVRIANG